MYYAQLLLYIMQEEAVITWWLYVSFFLVFQLIIIRIRLTASIQYKVGADVSCTVCSYYGSLQSKACCRVYDEWPGGDITLDTTYKTARIGWFRVRIF